MDNGTLPILQIIDHLGPGGAQRQFVELAIGLHERGYPLKVIALDDKLIEFVNPLLDKGVDVQLIRQSGKFDVQAARQLLQAIRAFEPAVVQTWLYTADMYGRVMAMLANLGKRSKSAVISSVRSAETDKKQHYVWVDRLLRPLTDAYVVNAAILGSTLQSREWVEPEKIRTIYNGINFDYFSNADAVDFDRAQGRKNSEWKVVYIGRLSQEKRPDLFIEAAALCIKSRQDISFHMIGSGDTAPYREQIKTLNLESIVNIEGFSDDIAPQLRSMDLLISCSEYEGCSNTVLEAMAAGVAVIATDVGGNSELLQDKYGWLVDANSSEAIATAVLDALSDQSRRDGARKRAYNRVRTEFSQSGMVSRYESLYRELLQ